MKIDTNQKGFSAILALFILATIAVGGYAAVQYSQNQKLQVESEQRDITISDIKENVKNDLSNIQTILNSNLGLEAKVKTTTDVLTQLKSDLVETKSDLSLEAQAEITELQSRINQLEIEIKSNTTTALDSVSDFIDDIATSIENNTEIESESNVESKDSSTEVDTTTNVESDTEANTENTDTSADVDAEIEVESSILSN